MTRTWNGGSILAAAGVIFAAGVADAAVMSGGVPDATHATLQLWLDAGHGVSHSGGAVTAWDDRSDKNHDATTYVGTSPTYVASDPNFATRPVINFTNDALRIPSTTGWGISGTADRTIFVVFREAAPGNANLVGYGVANTGQMVDVLIHSGELAGHYHGSGFDTIGGGPAYTAGTLGVGTHQYGTSLAADTYLRTTTGTASDSVTKSLNTQDGPFYVGYGVYTPINGYSGEIAEVLVYSERLSETDRLAVQEYLWVKYTTVPEPASAGLLALGGLVLMRRSN
jgi:hypothetical protein